MHKIAIGFVMLVLLIIVVAEVRIRSFSAGVDAGWNLAVEQCTTNMDNCVPTGERRRP